MKKVLFVNGCIRGAQSRTLRLAQRLVRQIPDADIEVLALPALHLTPYDAKDIAERDALSAAGAFSLPFSRLPTSLRTRTQLCSPARSGISACLRWCATIWNACASPA